MIHNLLSSNEITEILNNHIVQSNKELLSTLQQVDFCIQLPDAIKIKLETGLGIDLTQITSIPMRWIKGDTPPHIDKGESVFNTTFLVYLTDSIGNLIIDGQSYPITAGNAHIFSESIAHSTVNTGDSERLMIGPMSETGFQVGGAPLILYFDNETDANQMTNVIGSNYTNYTIETINDISSWNIAKNVDGTEPSPNGGPYNTGTVLINTGIYYLYPYTTPPPPSNHPVSMGSLFTNNAQVYYKPHSLSTGGGGSGVRNCRHKQRRT